jgi:putative DNA primase/helicase
MIAPEIPTGIADEIASWRRVFSRAAPESARSLLHRAAVELWRAVQISRTVDSNGVMAQQAMVDALHDFAVIGGIGDDDAQHIISEAKDAKSVGIPAPSNSDAEAADLNDDDARPPAFSDEALALRFAEQHAGQLRYVSRWARWLVWDENRWRFDETLTALNMARRLCRHVSAEAGKESKLAVAIASAKTDFAVERLARSDPRLAATTEQWDSNPWLLNTPAAIIDLLTGKARPHRPTEYMTKLTGVAPDPGCAAPTWKRFLHRVTGGDAELSSFLKRGAGYALTGSTQEHALFFLYGTGANGKSTFINAVTAAAGDYHRAAPIETFTASSGERHPTDLAGLRGARLVTSVETEEGRRWAESKIKALTGGDKIAARFMRQDFFEFTPTFKLMIAGNHKPGLRSVDEAIRRRFHLVPFTVTIPPNERDAHLPEKLKAELPGILAWMIEGCRDWRERGLAPPDAVRAATTAYLEGEDALAAWIEEATENNPTAWEASPALFKSWKAWAERAGEWVGSQRKFTQRLEDRGDAIGVRKGRDNAGRRGFFGLRVIDMAHAKARPEGGDDVAV